MGLVSGDSNCTRIDEQAAMQPVVGSWTFHKLISVISGASGILTILISLGLIIMHLLNQGNVNEQKLTLRVVWLPVTWSILAFFAVTNYNVALFLDPIPLLMEAIAVAAMFELFVTMLVPDDSEREAFFANAELQKRGKKIGEGGSLAFFKLTYVKVYQFPVVFVVFLIVEEGLAAADCPSNRIYKIVDILASVVSGVSTTIAVLALINFVSRFNKALKPGGAIGKFAMLKGVVGLTTTQQLIISILDKVHVIKSSDTVSYYDWTVGFPDMLINVELLIAALGFLWAYSWLPYTQKRVALMPQPASASNKKVNTFRFFLEGIYFPDLFKGVYQACKYLGQLVSGKGNMQRTKSWPSNQMRGRKQQQDDYSRLMDDHSPEPSADRIELSPSRPEYHSYNQHPHGASTLQPESAFGPPQYAYDDRVEGYAPPPTMPPHSQPASHMPQSIDPPSYSQQPTIAYDRQEQQPKHH